MMVKFTQNSIKKGNEKMEKVISPDMMKSYELELMEKGISSYELMKRVAEGAFKRIPENSKVGIVCGTGNNAGDGFALALLLTEAEVDVTIFLTKEMFTETSILYFNQCKEKNIKIENIGNVRNLKGFDCIVDCIFGIGLSRHIKDDCFVDAIGKINKSGAYVISIDINSGLNGNNGKVMGCCVMSDLTLSVGEYKAGHFLNDAKDYIGKLDNIDIGINATTYYSLVEKNDIKRVFKERKNNSNKGTYGYCALIGGTIEYSGAVKLANLSVSALKSGCGVVKLAVPKSISDGVIPYILESTMYTLSDKDGHIIFVREEIDKLLSGVNSVAVGMGMGKSEETYKVIKHILSNYSINVIIDADGLNSIAEYGIDILKSTKCSVILTPHPKEFERLFGVSVEEILESPIQYVLDFSRKYNVTLLLKGPSTIVCHNGEVYISSSGCAGMATAGSGDVLSGIILGICSQNNEKSKMVLNAVAGAYINGLAGEMAQKDLGDVSMTSSDTVNCIPTVIEMIRGNYNPNR